MINMNAKVAAYTFTILVALSLSNHTAKQGLTKAEQLAVAVPAIPGGNTQPDNDFARGLSNIQESWTGYANVAKSLDGATSN
jgi:hypothetical protein